MRELKKLIQMVEEYRYIGIESYSHYEDIISATVVINEDDDKVCFYYDREKRKWTKGISFTDNNRRNR